MKLIQTNFEYEFIGYKTKDRGSYLGRRKATLRTIKNFIKSNGSQPVCNVVLLDSFESQWVAK